MSPDPLGGSIQNPQSLNRYTYVLNNPESLVDPPGLCPQGQVKVNGSCVTPSTTVTVTAQPVCYGPPQISDPFAGFWGYVPYYSEASCLLMEDQMGAGGAIIFDMQDYNPGMPAIVCTYSGRRHPNRPQTRNQAAINSSAESTCGAAPPMSPTAPDPYGPLETYLYVNAQAMFQNGGSGPWGQDVRGCLACMHSQGASMSTSHHFCYVNASVRTGPLQSVEGLSQAIWAATETGLRQLSLVPWPDTPPFIVVYSPVPWR